MRKSGIKMIGDIPWGTHVCVFYQTPEDLTDILVPCFKTGLKNNEFCLLISESFSRKVAEKAFRKSIPDFDNYVDNGQIEIASHSEWYSEDGSFNLAIITGKLSEKLNRVLENGYEGIRMVTDSTLADNENWTHVIKQVSGGERKNKNAKVISLSTYSLDKCQAPDIIDVVNNHRYVFTRRSGKWDAIARYEYNQNHDALEKSVKEFRCLYDIARITSDPEITLNELYSVITHLIPQAFQHPKIAFARINVYGKEFQTGNYTDNSRKISADIFVQGDKVGTLEVGYTKTPPASENGLFSKQERLLLDAIGERLGALTEHRQSEEALRESENKFSIAFNSSPVMVIISELENGNYVEVNDTFCHITGYSRDELIGHNVDEFNLWEKPEDKENLTGMLLEHRKFRNEEVSFRMKSGEIRLWLCSAEIINMGNEPCMIAVATDITEQKQYQELLNTVYYSSPLGIYIIQDGTLQYTNPQLGKITGYSQEELLGLELLDLVAVEDKDAVRSSTIFTLREESPYPCEYRILNKTGQIKWMLQTVSPIRYQGKEAVLGNLMDITERKYLERKVVEYEELSQMKSNLLSTVSHELRTPLATIKGYSTMIIDYYTRLSSDETRDYLKSIDTSTDRLSRLVDNLLDTSRMESGLLKLQKAPTNVYEIIQSAVSEAIVRSNQHHINIISSNNLPKINVDGRRIRQVVDNLIDNAIKYSPEGTNVLISASRVDSDLLISVTDQGPGIPTDELKNIFERMYRIEERIYSGMDGIGLGLYICQRLVEAHGGRIWAESTPGKGSIIQLTLPIEEKPTEKKPLSGRARPPRYLSSK
jgi:PAS domain S-box-containing protein